MHTHEVNSPLSAKY